MKYTIKEVSEKTGISSYVLRYYEKEGLLPPVSRSKGGILVYTDSELEQLGQISCLKNTGMPLKDIRTFVQLQAEGPSTLRKRCEILKLQQEHVQQDIEKLQKTYEKVSHKLAHFSQQLETYEKEGESS